MQFPQDMARLGSAARAIPCLGVLVILCITVLAQDGAAQQARTSRSRAAPVEDLADVPPDLAGIHKCADAVVGFHMRDRWPVGTTSMTVDDGPSAVATARLLDLFKQYRIKATFFVIGARINRHSYQAIQRILREGHALGNHTYHHQYGTRGLPRLRDSVDYWKRELMATQILVDIALMARNGDDFDALYLHVLGVPTPRKVSTAWLHGHWDEIEARWRATLAERNGPVAPSMHWMRPPGGVPCLPVGTRFQVRSYVGALWELGMTQVLWNCGAHDATPQFPASLRRNPEWLRGNIVQCARRGGILVIHDYINLAGLRGALETLAGSGNIRFITLDQMMTLKYEPELEPDRELAGPRVGDATERVSPP